LQRICRRPKYLGKAIVNGLHSLFTRVVTKLNVGYQPFHKHEDRSCCTLHISAGINFASDLPPTNLCSDECVRVHVRLPHKRLKLRLHNGSSKKRNPDPDRNTSFFAQREHLLK
jgi:hypothetical protein